MPTAKKAGSFSSGDAAAAKTGAAPKRALAAPFQDKGLSENASSSSGGRSCTSNPSRDCVAAASISEEEDAEDENFMTHKNFEFTPLDSDADVTFERYCGPTPESNWVIPGSLLVGAYPASHDDGETFDLIISILRNSITKFVCLQQEYRSHGVTEAMWRTGKALRPYFEDVKLLVQMKHSIPELHGFDVVDESDLQFTHFPIKDCGITADARVLELARTLVNDISQGKVVYLHCWGGHGRTGTLVCMILHLMYGLDAMEAMARCQRVHDLRQCPVAVGSPQTQQQRDQVTRIVQRLTNQAPFYRRTLSDVAEVAGSGMGGLASLANIACAQREAAGAAGAAGGMPAPPVCGNRNSQSPRPALEVIPGSPNTLQLKGSPSPVAAAAAQSFSAACSTASTVSQSSGLETPIDLSRGSTAHTLSDMDIKGKMESLSTTDTSISAGAGAGDESGMGGKGAGGPERKMVRGIAVGKVTEATLKMADYDYLFDNDSKRFITDGEDIDTPRTATGDAEAATVSANVNVSAQPNVQHSVKMPELDCGDRMEESDTTERSRRKARRPGRPHLPRSPFPSPLNSPPLKKTYSMPTTPSRGLGLGLSKVQDPHPAPPSSSSSSSSSGAAKRKSGKAMDCQSAPGFAGSEGGSEGGEPASTVPTSAGPPFALGGTLGGTPPTAAMTAPWTPHAGWGIDKVN